MSFFGQDTGGETVVYLSAGLLAAFLMWAGLTQIDEVTRGDGKIIPALKTQTVQSSEAAIVSEILVRLGQKVTKGDLLMKLDTTPTSVNAGEVAAKYRALQARVARLELERTGVVKETFPCPDDVQSQSPEVCETEATLYRSRVATLDSRIKIAEEKAEQKRREMAEADANFHRLTDSLKLARQELAMIEPLAARNIVAQMELIRARRSVSEAEGQLNAVIEIQEKLKSAQRETELLIDGERMLFQQEALRDLSVASAELSIIQETSRGATERLRRTDIRSPVDGIVNEVIVNTHGAFVNPGEKVVSIVPILDTLLVETKVKPSDIAFIHSGQKAVVKITAFDFSIFGGLEGTVESVAADTIVSEVTKEPYYTVLVRTSATKLQSARGEYEIMPGMVCNVDILTGRKTILQYLLKPINKARNEALRER